MNFDEFNAILGILALLASLNVPTSALAVMLWIYIVITQFQLNQDN